MTAGKKYHRASSAPVKVHRPMQGFVRELQANEARVEQVLDCVSFAQISKQQLRFVTGEGSEAKKEFERNLAAAKRAFDAQKNQNGKIMTVSLYKSTASGKIEIVVQTNAQSLDLFIAGLADAVSEVIEKTDESDRMEVIASVFKNAFPLAFAIAGYKADKVFESRMLVCGAIAADQASLLAHSKT